MPAIEPLYAWAVIAGLFVVTVITRAFFVVLGDSVKLPERLQRAMRYAPAIAMACIVAPVLFIENGHLTSLTNPLLWGGVAAFVIAAASRSIVLTMVGGMAVLTLLRLWVN